MWFYNVLGGDFSLFEDGSTSVLGGSGGALGSSLIVKGGSSRPGMAKLDCSTASICCCSATPLCLTVEPAVVPPVRKLAYDWPRWSTDGSW